MIVERGSTHRFAPPGACDGKIARIYKLLKKYRNKYKYSESDNLFRPHRQRERRGSRPVTSRTLNYWEAVETLIETHFGGAATVD